MGIASGDSTEEISSRRTPQRRMCVDFRRLKKQLPEVKNMSGGKGCISPVPLPKIDELYVKLQGYKVSAP